MQNLAYLADAASGPLQGAVALGALVLTSAPSRRGAWLRRFLFGA